MSINQVNAALLHTVYYWLYLSACLAAAQYATDNLYCICYNKAFGFTCLVTLGHHQLVSPYSLIGWSYNRS